MLKNFLQWNLFLCLHHFVVSQKMDMQHTRGRYSRKNGDLWGSFVRTSKFACIQDQTDLQCPLGMHLNPLAINVLDTIPLNVKVLSGNARHPTCSWPNAYKLPRMTMGPGKCLSVTALENVRQQCEGRHVCRLVGGAQLRANHTDCERIMDFSYRLDYQCLPDPGTGLMESICADTYLEVKCPTNAQSVMNGVDNNPLVLAILNAELNHLIQASPDAGVPGCPSVRDNQRINSRCPTKLDITRGIRERCDGQDRCSISPSMGQQSDERFAKCGKMHLEVSYVCVPSNWVITPPMAHDMEETFDQEQRQTKEQQANRMVKPGVESSLPNHNLRIPMESIPDRSIIPPISDVSSFDRQKPESHLTDEHPANQPDLSLPSNIIQPLMIGIGIGISLLLVGLVLAILICRWSPARKHPIGDNKRSARHACSVNHSALSSCPHMENRDTFKSSSCPSCLPHDPTIISPYPEKCMCAENLGPNFQNYTVMQDSYYPRHPQAQCAYGSIASSVTPTPNVPMQLPEYLPNGQPLGPTSLPYMYGIASEGTLSELPNPHALDQQSISQSHSSSSGVGLSNAHHGFNPAYNLETNQPLVEFRNIRLDSGVYSGTPNMYKASSIAGSSSGRGCDGGSGGSEIGEPFHCSSPPTKSLYSTIHPPGTTTYHTLGTRKSHYCQVLPITVEQLNNQIYEPTGRNNVLVQTPKIQRNYEPRGQYISMNGTRVRSDDGDTLDGRYNELADADRDNSSTGSVTEPLLEPPTRFRTAFRTNVDPAEISKSPKKICQHFRKDSSGNRLAEDLPPPPPVTSLRLLNGKINTRPLGYLSRTPQFPAL